jgi:hypothetical protein
MLAHKCEECARPVRGWRLNGVKIWRPVGSVSQSEQASRNEVLKYLSIITKLTEVLNEVDITTEVLH